MRQKIILLALWKQHYSFQWEFKVHSDCLTIYISQSSSLLTMQCVNWPWGGNVCMHVCEPRGISPSSWYPGCYSAELYLWHTENTLKKCCFLTMTSWAICSSGGCWARELYVHFWTEWAQLIQTLAPLGAEPRGKGKSIPRGDHISWWLWLWGVGTFPSSVVSPQERPVVQLVPRVLYTQSRFSYLNHQWKQEVMKQNSPCIGTEQVFFLFVISH